MTSFSLRLLGAFVSIIALLGSGAANAENDCSAKTIMSLPWGEVTESAVACADLRGDPVYLFNLAEDIYKSSDGNALDADWESSLELYEEFLTRADKLPAGTRGAISVDAALATLANYFKDGVSDPLPMWPRDLEKAKHYQRLLLNRLQARSDVNAATLSVAWQQMADIDRQISQSVGYLKGDLSPGSDPAKTPAVTIDGYVIAITEIRSGEYGEVRYRLSVKAKRMPYGTSRSDICLKISPVRQEPELYPARGSHFGIDHSMFSMGSGETGYRNDYRIPVYWPEDSEMDSLRVEIQTPAVRAGICEWWYKPWLEYLSD